MSVESTNCLSVFNLRRNCDRDEHDTVSMKGLKIVTRDVDDDPTPPLQSPGGTSSLRTWIVRSSRSLERAVYYWDPHTGESRWHLPLREAARAEAFTNLSGGVAFFREPLTPTGFPSEAYSRSISEEWTARSGPRDQRTSTDFSEDDRRGAPSSSASSRTSSPRGRVALVSDSPLTLLCHQIGLDKRGISHAQFDSLAALRDTIKREARPGRGCSFTHAVVFLELDNAYDVSALSALRSLCSSSALCIVAIAEADSPWEPPADRLCCAKDMHEFDEVLVGSDVESEGIAALLAARFALQESVEEEERVQENRRLRRGRERRREREEFLLYVK